MLIKRRYSIRDMMLWSRTELLLFIVLSTGVTLLHEIAGLRWMQLPWLPVALIGTAVAFIIGFQNNVTYDRIWEARKIWGGIVNVSRSWGMMVKDNVDNGHTDTPVPREEIHGHIRTLFYRHFAWLTALRYAMRQERKWEVFLRHRTNREWSRMIHIPEREAPLDEELRPLLSASEHDYVMEKDNKCTALLYLQSTNLRELKERGLIWEFAFLELENILQKLFDLQGKSERIKNFPYPRQYATLNNYFVWIFIVLLPFGVVPAFEEIGDKLSGVYPRAEVVFAWFAIPFVVVVQWIFHTMERIGRVGENPFEGSANDVPISAISRGIETDMRQMLDEPADLIPAPFPVRNDVQM